MRKMYVGGLLNLADAIIWWRSFTTKTTSNEVLIM